MLRIIAGRSRGLTLDVPPGRGTRPMQALARGALFNILCGEIPDARVLDLYAGCGSLGLEALSRGAAECVFVESNRGAVECLEFNLERSGMAGGEVMNLPAAIAFKRLEAGGRSFSLIFYDPPFRNERTAGGRAGTAEELVAAATRLAPGGLIVWRLERCNFYAEDVPASLSAVDRREYGRSLLIFLRPSAVGSPPAETSPGEPVP